MILQCISNDPASLVPEHRPLGMREAFFPITPGQDYVITGMTLTDSNLVLLTLTDWELPLFLPAGLFERRAASIPPEWFFSLAPGINTAGTERRQDPIEAIWGYAELVEDEDHVQMLLEGDVGARSVFQRHFDAARRSGD